jgi:hypothetical protein
LEINKIKICYFYKKPLVSSKRTCIFAPSKKSKPKKENTMYWTLELASKLEDAPWPATRDELLDWALRTGAQEEIIENLQEMEDEGEIYERIEDLWPDYPSKDDFFFNEDEY